MSARTFVFAALMMTGIVAVVRADELSPAQSRIAALDRTIMVREARDGKRYGENEIDPLLWGDSNYFLKGESHRRLLGALKEVASLTDAGVQRCPPSQRALVQNRVWAVFDYVWNHPAAGAGLDRELLGALARVMSKLALTLGSVNSVSFFTHQTPLAHLVTPGEEREAAATSWWKENRAEWGGLKVFWPAALPP